MAEYFSMLQARSTCADCGYVAGGLVADPHATCPNCGGNDVNVIWPDISALTLLDMVIYFDQLAQARNEDAQTTIAQRVSDVLHCEVAPQTLADVALEAQDVYNQAGDSRWEAWVSDKMLDVVKTRLGLATREEALAIWAELGQYSDTVEEHKVVVILACTYLERLFGDVLVMLAIKSGKTAKQAEKKVDDDLQSMPKREAFFKQHTSIDVNDALAACAPPSFSADWSALRKARNDFIHGFPWAIHGTTARLAVKVASDAIPVFAELQNRYCIRWQKASGSQA